MAKLEQRWSHHGPKMAQQQADLAQESAKIEPRWPSWSQDGAHRAPRWPKMRQHKPRRAPRSAQDGQVGAMMETTWPQDAKDVPAWADTCAYLEKPPFSHRFYDFRNPEGAHDGPEESQDRAKMAKLEPRWPKRAPRSGQDGQVGANMEPTWPQDGRR